MRDEVSRWPLRCWALQARRSPHPQHFQCRRAGVPCADCVEEVRSQWLVSAPCFDHGLAGRRCHAKRFLIHGGSGHARVEAQWMRNRGLVCENGCRLVRRRCKCLCARTHIAPFGLKGEAFGSHIAVPRPIAQWRPPGSPFSPKRRIGCASVVGPVIAGVRWNPHRHGGDRGLPLCVRAVFEFSCEGLCMSATPESIWPAVWAAKGCVAPA